MERARTVLPTLTAIFFVAFCCAPIAAKALSWGEQTAEAVKQGENRAIATMPPINIFSMRYSQIKRLPGLLEQYLTDTFPYRMEMIAFLASLKRESPASLDGSVIKGRDGWLYYNPASGPGVDDFLGKIPFSRELALRQIRGLDEKRKFYEAGGAKFYFVIAPNKITIHPEHLPEPLLAGKGKTYREQFAECYREYVAANAIPDFVIDLADPLRRAKESHGTLYSAMDTHWNWIGRAVAGNAIFERVRRDFPDLPEMPALDLRPGPAAKDLLRLGVPGIASAAGATDPYPVPEQWSEIAGPLPPDLQGGLPADTTGARYLNPRGSVDAYYLGDSFFEIFQPPPEALVFRDLRFMSNAARLYSTPDNVRRRVLDKKPRIVVEEAVERNFGKEFWFAD